MAKDKIPSQVVIVVGDVLGHHYYNHTALNSLFAEHGAPGDVPEGNCVRKCQAWLKRCNEDPTVDPFIVLGGVLADFMDLVREPFWQERPAYIKRRSRVETVLAKNGLTYHSGGRVIGGLGVPSRSLAEVLRDRDLLTLETEFGRAAEMVSQDPAGALTASCAILESLCKVYIADRGLELPRKQDVRHLWGAVARDPGLTASADTPRDVAPILSGFAAVVDGLGAYRTHHGTAHGHGEGIHQVRPRHARLAVHAAHTLVVFAIETWAECFPEAPDQPAE